MADNTYTLTTGRRVPKPRSKRLRECGYYTQGAAAASASTTTATAAAEVAALRETIRELTAQVGTLSAQVAKFAAKGE